MTFGNNEHIVISIFANQAAADQAIKWLKHWNTAGAEPGLAVVGTLTREGDTVVTRWLVRPSPAPALARIANMITAILSGATRERAVGAFTAASLHLAERKIRALGSELDAGKVAVMLICDEPDVEPMMVRMATTGRVVRAYVMPQVALSTIASSVWPT